MRELFTVEKGLQIVPANSDVGVSIISGAGVPGGDAGEQDAAEVGSLYLRTTGQIYKKIGSANLAADWENMQNVDLSLFAFRSEHVVAATGDVAPASGSVRNLTTTPFGDDQAPTLSAADFVVGDHIIFGVGGVPKLMRVSVVSSPSITVVDAVLPIANNNGFMVENYLPDSPDAQEKQALVMMSAGAIIKLGDVNWNFADGINLAAAYAAQNGVISSADSVNSAIEKLDGNQQDIQTTLGVAQGAVNLGAFSGLIIPDNQNVKQALQALETEIENGGRTGLVGVTTVQTVDSVLVDLVPVAKWYVEIEKSSAPGNKVAMEVLALNNGTASADASSVDKTVYSKLKVGSNFNYTLNVVLAGVGAAQTMGLTIASAEVGGVSIKVFREMVK
jgi:hypothetical protein